MSKNTPSQVNSELDQTIADQPARFLVPVPDLQRTVPGTEPPDLRYAVTRILGSGANGTVFAASDSALGRDLAIKVLASGDPDRIRRFVMEARTTAQLDHPGIVPIYDIDVAASGEVYLTMRQVRGESMGSAIERVVAGESVPVLTDYHRLANLFIALCDALACAHAKQVIHRDIKPDNVMLGSFGEAMLVDWGLAVSHEIDQKATIAGTPLYMSPEQARGEPADERSDIYSLGATLFHALFLRPPLMPQAGGHFWESKKRGSIDLPTTTERRRVPPGLDAIARKAMQADPGKRYQNSRALADDLRGWAAGMSITAMREPPYRRLVRWLRFYRRRIAIALVLFFVVSIPFVILARDRLKDYAYWGLPEVVDPGTNLNRLKTDWVLMEGSRWTATSDGYVTGEGNGHHLYFRRQCTGPVAIEFTGQIEAGSPMGDLSASWTPIDPATPGFSPWRQGYMLQVGAMDNTRIQIRDASIGGVAALALASIESGRDYRLRFEIDGDRLAIHLDGKLMIEHRTAVPCGPGWIGLMGYYSGKNFRDIVIYSKGLPQRLPATATGDTLLSLGHNHDAAVAYAVVADRYADSTLGLTARYRQGLAMAKAGNINEANTVWSKITDPQLVSQVACRKMEFLLAMGELPAAAELFSIAHKGNAEASAEALLARGLALAQADSNPHYSMRSWLSVIERIEIPSHFVRVTEAQARYRLGEYDTVARRFPDLVQAAESLVAMGRFDEALDKPDYPVAHVDALLALGRYGEIASRYPKRTSAIVEALVHQSRFDEALSLSAGNAEMSYTTKLLSGRAEEVLAELDRNDWSYIRCSALVQRHREQEVVRAFESGTKHPGMSLTLLRCGMSEAALACCHPLDHSIVAQILAWKAVEYRSKNDEAGEREVLKRFARVPISAANSAGWMEAWFLIPAMQSLAGDSRMLRSQIAMIRSVRPSDRNERAWYMASLLDGAISEDEFRSQACSLGVAGASIWIKALRAELANDVVAARKGWRDYLSLEFKDRNWANTEGAPALDRFAQWRLEFLAVSGTGRQ